MCIFSSPKMPEIKTTAREVIPETNAKPPDSPQYGDGTKSRKAGATGKKALMIKSGGSGTGLNI